MEEQITQKQYQTLKASRGCLTALYVIYIIVGVVSAISLIMAFYFSFQGASSIVTFIPIVAALIALHMLLYNQKPGRKNAVAVSMLVFAIAYAAANLYTLLIGMYGNSLLGFGFDYLSTMFGKPQFGDVYNIIVIIVFAIAAAAFILLAVQLLRKIKSGQSGSFPSKAVFMVCVVCMYAYMFMQVITSIPAGMDWSLGVLIAACIIGGLAMVLMLAPQFVVYKSLTDEAYYENFIVMSPLIAIGKYEGVQVKPAAAAQAAQASQAAEEARFCMKCGAALPPSASFCKACGTPVKPLAKPVAGTEL
ncbi:MAG: zinc ribbon domain-containing protein [Eubacteriales bacterium]